MNISALTKGFVLPFFRYRISYRRGGGSLYGENYNNLKEDIKKLQTEDEIIDYITIYVEWDKFIDNYDKKIYVEIIKTKIEAQLIIDEIKDIKINVELMD